MKTNRKHSQTSHNKTGMEKNYRKQINLTHKEDTQKTEGNGEPSLTRSDRTLEMMHEDSKRPHYSTKAVETPPFTSHYMIMKNPI